MNWWDTSGRERRPVIAGAIALVLVLSVRLALLPAARAMAADGATLSRERELLALEARLVRESSGFPVQFDSLANGLLGWTPSLLPSGSQAVAQALLAGRIKEAASVGGVTLNSVTPLEARANEQGFIEHRMGAKGEGRFEEIVQMLGELERGDLLVDVAMLNVVSRNVGGVMGEAGDIEERLELEIEILGLEVSARQGDSASSEATSRNHRSSRRAGRQ